MHILIVEDEQRLARLVARVLSEERHVVDIADDGDTGMDLALRGPMTCSSSTSCFPDAVG